MFILTYNLKKENNANFDLKKKNPLKMQFVIALFKSFSNITGVAFININHCNIINIYKMVLGGFFANFDFTAETPLYIFILIHFFYQTYHTFWCFQEHACLDEFLGQSSSRTRTF